MMDQYKGWHSLTEEEMNLLYSNKLDLTSFYENEYILCGTEVYKYQNGFLKRCDYPTIESHWCGKIKPRNIEQFAAIDMMNDDKSQFKLICGKPGSGKTMILAHAAMKKLEDGAIEQIIYIRNNVQVKDTDNLGALPGDEYDKMLPYLGPLLDHIGGEQAAIQLIDKGQLFVEPLGFLRGRNLQNSLIFCTEGENLTRQQIQLIIGRAAEGSLIYMDADVKQRDRINFEKSQGIEKLIDKCKGYDLFAYVHLEKTERSRLAAMADLLDE